MSLEPMRMTYEESSYEDLFLFLLMALYRDGIITDDSNFSLFVSNKDDLEGTIPIIASNWAVLLSYVYKDLTKIYNARNVYKAQDNDLIIFGYSFFDIIPASASIGEVTITLSEPAENNIILSEGLICTTDDVQAIMFKTIQEKTLVTGETEITIPIQCTQTGTIGNVPSGSIINIQDIGVDVESVTNSIRTSGGRYEEDIEAYRQRLFNWKYILEKGTYYAIINLLMEIAPVEGYYIDRYWDGNGSCRIIIDPPLDYLITLVEENLESVKACDEPYFVFKVEEVPIDTSCILNISLDETIPIPDSKKSMIKSQAESLIFAYINGGTNLDGSPQKSLGIGVDFTPFKLGVYLANQIPELKNVEFVYPLTPITIRNHQRAVVNSVNLTVV